MTVGEGETAGQMVVEPGQVIEAVLRGLVGPAGHARAEISHVNAILAHIEKDKHFERAGHLQLRLLHVDDVVAKNRAPISIGAAPAPQENVHGHRAHAGLLFAIHHDE
jgi:hypothetical protein